MSGGDLPPQMLQTLAMSVVSSFAIGEDMASHENLHSLLPLMRDVLADRYGGPRCQLLRYHTPRRTESFFFGFYGEGRLSQTPEDTCQADILQTLFMVSKTGRGAQQVLLSDYLPLLARGLRSPALPEDHLLVILSICHNLFQDRQLIARSLPAVVALLPPLAALFKQNQQALKFRVLDSLVATLSLLLHEKESSPSLHATVNEEMERVTQSTLWAADIRHALNDLLVSKISTKERDPALMLVFLMMTHLGGHWLFVPIPLATQGAKDAGAGGKFVSVAMNLVCVETRIILEDQELSKLPDESAHKLVVYFEILEMAIQHTALLAESK